MTDTLPRWASDILHAAPTRGDGLNRWLMRGAIALRRCGRDETEIVNELQIATAGEAVKPGEIERAVERSTAYLTNGAAAKPQKKWPDLDSDLRQKTIDATPGVGEAALWETSPYRLLDDGPDTEALIDSLFPADALLCCAGALHAAKTRPRDNWRGELGRQQFIVPSPMSALRGLTQDGRSSARCLGNTGPRRFLVVEQDTGTADEQAAILLHLAERAPLALALFSGGKSLHGWFACKDASDQTLTAFFRDACRLGADPATWTRCQMVRMPEARRDNGNRQRVLFFNREVTR